MKILVSIGGCYGLSNDTYDINRTIEIYMDSLGSYVMPIADAGGGDIIYIGLKSQYRGRIYFWHHEEEMINEDGNEQLYLIANSFQEFIFNFTPHKKESKVNPDDVRIFLVMTYLKINHYTICRAGLTPQLSENL